MVKSTPNGNGDETLRLRLFVSGATPRSLQAVSVVRKQCEAQWTGRYTLDVIDIYRHPAMARQNRIVVVPTLLKLSPNPTRLFIGDIVDPALLADGLGLFLSPQAKRAAP